MNIDNQQLVVAASVRMLKMIKPHLLLLERARYTDLGFPAVFRKKKLCHLCHVINPSLNKLVLSRGLDLSLVRLSQFIDTHTENARDQYTAILTSCLVNKQVKEGLLDTLCGL